MRTVVAGHTLRRRMLYFVSYKRKCAASGSAEDVSATASPAIPHTFVAATQSCTSRASSGSSSCCPPSPSLAHVHRPTTTVFLQDIRLTLVACERCAAGDSREQHCRKALPRAVVAFVEEKLNKSEPADTGEITAMMLWCSRHLQRDT